ncbi:MAG TPA: nitronate monooxygenase [Acidobacteriota bacterium]|nr:nitronate monooxygenase [Acidobacteriota bacterium]
MNFNNFPKFQLPRLQLPRLDLPEWIAPKKDLPPLAIGDLRAAVPIVQGGMGVGISLAGLAAAVAEAGGIGVIAANAIGMIEPDYYDDGRAADQRALRSEIRRARARTRGVIGVNLMVAVNDFHELLQVVVEERPDIVFLGAGLPLRGIPVAALRAANVKVAPIVSSGRAARLIFTHWRKSYGDVPDAVVVEGPLAGGHLGFKPEQIDDPAYALERIVPDVIAEVRPFEAGCGRAIPVIAGGGVYTGADIHRILRLGARGVQLGTRFVATDECDADPRFKEAYVRCRAEDIVIIKSPVGLPGRAIRNPFLEEVARGARRSFRCPWRCLESCDARAAAYCISLALDSARQGRLDEGFAFAGANAHRVDRIVPVRELMDGLKAEYAAAVEAVARSIGDEYARLVERWKGLKDEYGAAVARLAELRDEYERAWNERIARLKNDYENVWPDKIAALRAEYEGAWNEKVAAVREQYEAAAAALEQLRAGGLDLQAEPR